MARRVLLFDLYDGDAGTAVPGTIRRTVKPQSGKWTSKITGDGDGKFTFRTDDAEERTTRTIAQERAQREEDFRPNARGIAVLDERTVLYAGKIEDWSYSRDAGTFEVSTVEIREELSWRLMHRVGEYQQGTLSVASRSSAGAIRAILDRATGLTDEFALPIDLPADGAGSITEKWKFWKKLKADELIEQIEDRGCELVLVPYLVVDGSGREQAIRWAAVVDTRVTLESTTFMLNADESPLSGITYQCDGKQQITQLLGIGTGSGEDQPTAWDGRQSDRGIIQRSTIVTFEGLKGDALQAATSREMDARERPSHQLSITTYTPSAAWPAEHATTGREWRVSSHDDPVIPDATFVMRLVQTSGGVSEGPIAVEVQ